MVDFVHEALFYQDRDQYLAATVPFVLDGLAGGEPVLVAVPSYNVDLIRDELGAKSEHVRFLDMTQGGRNPGRIIPGVLTPFSNEHPSRVRIIGEPIWAGRSVTEYPACVQHEALINTAFNGVDATILCPYDTSGLAPDVLVDAERTHPVLLADGDRRPSPRYDDPRRIVTDFNVPLPTPPRSAVAYWFDMHSLPATRRLVTDYATTAGLTEDRVDDLVLAVNELTTNSIEHANGGGELLVWQEGDAVVCEVRDQGTLRDPMVGRLRPSASAQGGYGVVMVNLLCDLVRVHSGDSGTAIRVHVG
ncbi:sensor histidine kinase [Umezawaea sp.]|uniref:sensor histidine kinase n=1 Tax=Umezawaea sp. TaxID=1955258 RepID=UPI002ED231CB